MTNETVTPENTKLIAEWMRTAWRMVYIDSTPNAIGHKYIEIMYNGGYVKYNLITNATQSRDIEEMLLGLGWRLSLTKKNGYLLHNLTSNFSMIKAETLTLAIYKAALFEAKKNENSNNKHNG